MMTREKAEQAIYEKMQEIRDIMEKYCPEDSYLTLCISQQNGHIWFNNAYWDENVHPVDFTEEFDTLNMHPCEEE